MGIRHSRNNQGREIGEGVATTCDLPGCDMAIDRGAAYCCGGHVGLQNAGIPRESYCGKFVCKSHLRYLPSKARCEDRYVCIDCYRRQECPDCVGLGRKEDSSHPGEYFGCSTCDTFGHVRHCWSENRQEMIPC